jgi:DNA-binding beta-propeller fold protein YncE
MKFNRLLLASVMLFFLYIECFAQVKRIDIGTVSEPLNADVSLKLIHRFQRFNKNVSHVGDNYDTTIHSPKSVNILDSNDKFYIHSLEGCRTSVYSLSEFKLLKTINHKFDASNQHLFKDSSYFDYQFRTRKNQLNYFSGKPVESCFSHNGKYLWVTYYRRTYDLNAIDPSAVCIIDTETDSIVRVMPTAPLPKMISSSPDSRTVAITHWGDNTMALIDISSENPADFRYLNNIAIDKRLSLNFNDGDTIDRDNNCGNCLRGTVFTPDNKFVLIGKMGSNSVAIVDVENRKYLKSVAGMKTNMRHLIISNNNLYLSINKTGFVQKTDLNDFLNSVAQTKKPILQWKSTFVGEGARTIVADPTGRYIFAAINNISRISVVRTSDMKVIAHCPADSYPVGMDISSDGRILIVTSQGRNNGGGNSVMVYRVEYQQEAI